MTARELVNSYLFGGQHEAIIRLIEEQAARIKSLEKVVAVTAPPEGGPVVAVPVRELNDLRADLERLREALKIVEFGHGDGCPDCGASGKGDDYHRTCCVIVKALYGDKEVAHDG